MLSDLCVPYNKLSHGDYWPIHTSSGSKASLDHDISENCNPVVKISLSSFRPGIRAYLPVKVGHVEHDGGALVVSPLVCGDLTPPLNNVTRAQKLKCRLDELRL